MVYLSGMEWIADRWFTLLYPTLGVLLLSSGIWLWLARTRVVEVVLEWARADSPPPMILSFLRTLLFMALPTLLLSFWSRSWVEILFAVWFLAMLFIFGQLLVRWRATAMALQAQGGDLSSRIRFIGLNMISLGAILFLLLYNLKAPA